MFAGVEGEGFVQGGDEVGVRGRGEGVVLYVAGFLFLGGGFDMVSMVYISRRLSPPSFVFYSCVLRDVDERRRTCVTWSNNQLFPLSTS